MSGLAGLLLRSCKHGGVMLYLVYQLVINRLLASLICTVSVEVGRFPCFIVCVCAPRCPTQLKNPSEHTHTQTHQLYVLQFSLIRQKNQFFFCLFFFVEVFIVLHQIAKENRIHPVETAASVIAVRRPSSSARQMQLSAARFWTRLTHELLWTTWQHVRKTITNKN